MTNIFKAPAEYAEAILAVNGQDRDAAIRFFEFYIGEDERFNGVPGTRQWAQDVLAILRGPSPKVSSQELAGLRVRRTPIRQTQARPMVYEGDLQLQSIRLISIYGDVSEREVLEGLLAGSVLRSSSCEYELVREAPEAPEEYVIINGIGGFKADFDAVAKVAKRLEGRKLLVGGTQERDAQEFFQQLVFSVLGDDWAYLGTDRYIELAERLLAGETLVNQSSSCPLSYVLEAPKCPITPARARFIVDNFVTTGFYQQGKQYAQALTRDELKDLWAYIGSKDHDLVNAWIEALAELVPSTKPQGRLQAAQDRLELHKLVKGHTAFNAQERSEQLQAYQASRNAQTAQVAA